MLIFDGSGVEVEVFGGSGGVRVVAFGGSVVLIPVGNNFGAEPTVAVPELGRVSRGFMLAGPGSKVVLVGTNAGVAFALVGGVSTGDGVVGVVGSVAVVGGVGFFDPKTRESSPGFFSGVGSGIGAGAATVVVGLFAVSFRSLIGAGTDAFTFGSSGSAGRVGALAFAVGSAAFTASGCLIELFVSGNFAAVFPAGPLVV